MEPEEELEEELKMEFEEESEEESEEEPEEEEMIEAWRVAEASKNDKYQYTYFGHKINSFNSAPNKVLASNSHLRPNRYALEQGDLPKAGAEKSSFFTSVAENRGRALHVSELEELLSGCTELEVSFIVIRLGEALEAAVGKVAQPRRFSMTGSGGGRGGNLGAFWWQRWWKK
ncbi:hypothetical protein NL676_002089 [Syzygium grande]|nr:hypothetical protein NL676_002089 [Syzygium grande]